MWPFSSKTLTDKTTLIEMAAKDLPWQATKSGMAVLTVEALHDVHANKKLEALWKKLHDMPGLVDGNSSISRASMTALGTAYGTVISAIDPQLEQAIRAAKNIDVYLIAGKPMPAETAPADISAAAMIAKGNQKTGIEKS